MRCGCRPAAQNADGQWGAKTFYYDGLGNRTQEIITPPGGSATTSVLGCPSGSNRVVDVTQGSTTVRSFGYDVPGMKMEASTITTGQIIATAEIKATRIAEAR